MTGNTIAITTSSFDKAGEHLVRRIEKSGFVVKLNPYGRKMTPEESRSFLKAEVVGMIAGVEILDDTLFSQMPKLKVIVRAGIGMDAVDIISAVKRGIIVDNTPKGPVVAVSELTIGLMICLLRRIVEADRRLRQQKWQALMGSLLTSQKIGIIGCGRIGSRVAKLLKAFGCRVVVSDPALSIEQCNEIGVKYLSMDDLLVTSDMVSLHLPYSPATHHIIAANELQKMKKGAFIINVGRGGLIDEKALFKVLKNGKLAGAALDTYEKEPYTGPICQLDNVVLTSHMGSYAVESRAMMEKDAVDKLLTHLNV